MRSRQRRKSRATCRPLTDRVGGLAIRVVAELLAPPQAQREKRRFRAQRAREEEEEEEGDAADGRREGQRGADTGEDTEEGERDAAEVDTGLVCMCIYIHV